MTRCNSHVCSHAPCRIESGQALVEATIVLLLFSGLMLCGKLTASMQLRGLDLLRDTAVHVFTLNKGQKIWVDSKLQVMQRVVIHDGLDSSSIISEHPMLNDLGIQSPGRIKTISKAMQPALGGAQEVYRQSYIEVGNGHATDDSDVQRRIENSYHVWQGAHSHSLHAIKTLGAERSTIDQPWNRKKLGSDWLERWKGMIPDQKYR